MTRRIVVLLGLLAVAGLLAANWPTRSLPDQIRADSLLVRKSDRQLVVFGDSRLLKTYTVSLGRAPTGAKEQEGDRRTPEGLYLIDSRLEASAFHLALHISYPDSADAAVAEQAGVEPGGAIMIHGIRNGLGFVGRLHRLVDWTSGCIAVTNSEIEQLWDVVDNGTPIRIVP